MPKLTLTDKLAPFLTKHKRVKIAFGGRGGTKSVTIADVLLHLAFQQQYKVGCFREHQNTIEDSVHALLDEEIQRLNIPGFVVNDKEIKHIDGGKFKFRGLARHIGGIKSFHGFKVFWIEEGQFLSETSLQLLLPTLREKGSELWVTMNPLFEEDAIYDRYILPHLNELVTDGVYEDDECYIVWTNFDENPWFPEVLEKQRKADYERLSRTDYDHIWLGYCANKVDNALIQREWFDACIDAHIKLGFEPRGVKILAHDPADIGPDANALAYRHGSVVLDLDQDYDIDINEGGSWAATRAIEYQVDEFVWDCDGLGVGLNGQYEMDFKSKRCVLTNFKGSKTPDYPEARFEGDLHYEQGLVEKVEIKQRKTNKEALKNTRAQYYLMLRNRIYRTYRAVVHGEYYDPDLLLSFSSNMRYIQQLRLELTRMPIKPNNNGLFELYTKKEMQSKFKFNSPNLSDSVMMSLRTAPLEMQYTYVPRSVPQLGIRR